MIVKHWRKRERSCGNRSKGDNTDVVPNRDSGEDSGQSRQKVGNMVITVKLPFHKIKVTAGD